jgi:purine-binding chemotaxis protein CheW
MAALDSKQYIVTYLNKEQYGIDIKFIDNIIVMQSITRVPKAQSYFKGVINLRGEIVPVMSLRSKLDIPEEAFSSKTRIIIVRPEPQAAPVGLIVDEVKEVITLDSGAIEKMTYDEKDVKANYSMGIGKYGVELINLLNIPAIVIDKYSNI